MTFATFAFDWCSCLRTPTAFSICFFPCFSCTTAFLIFFFACCSCWTAFYYTHCETSEKTPEINKKLHKKLSDTTVNYFCGLWPPVSGSSSGSSGHCVSQPSFSCFCWCRASTGDLRLLFHLRERSPVRTGWSSPLLRCRHLRLRSLVAIAQSSPMQRCWLQFAGLWPVGKHARVCTCFFMFLCSNVFRFLWSADRHKNNIIYDKCL